MRLLSITAVLSLLASQAPAQDPTQTAQTDLALHARQSPAALSLERITADPPLSGRLPRQAQISPGGRWISFLRPAASDSEVLELWAQPSSGGEPRRLVASSDLLDGAEQKTTEAEKMALERQRITQRGITDYQWCGKDDEVLLLPLSGDLYLVRLGGNAPSFQRLSFDAGSPRRDPRCSPDGRRVAFVRDGNLWVLDLVPGASPRVLTTDGSATLSWGLAEFIAAEELDRKRGFWWSPDGLRLLALRVDESPVGLKTRARIFADRTAMTEQRYPAAGEPNAKVSAHVVDARSGAMRPLPLPADAEYIARAGWFKDGTPWLQWLPRDQTRLTLTEYNTNGPRMVTTETDAAWVDVHDDLAELADGRLLWSSETSGQRQLVMIDRKSGTRSPLTQQPETVLRLICAGAQGVLYSAATDRGRASELFVADLNGVTRPLPGSAPRQWRSAIADEGCSQALVTRSAWGSPPVLELRPLTGERVTQLPGDSPDTLLATLGGPQALDLRAADGHSALNAFFFPPRPSTTKSPLLVLAYGGPGAATVGWRWSGDTALIAYWQQRGYGVLMLDTRGSSRRDRDFMRAHYRAFGQVEVADLFAAVRQLPALLPQFDPQRVGFFGGSYGGFLGARAMLDADTPFAAAVAVAPVTDWTLYDTAYTERYLGMPDAGRAPAYAAANLQARAALLQKPLMLVHGTADDNVLFEHSLRLMEALQNEGKIFDTIIYPGKAHGIAGRKARLHLYRSVDSFLEKHLKP